MELGLSHTHTHITGVPVFHIMISPVSENAEKEEIGAGKRRRGSEETFLFFLP